MIKVENLTKYYGDFQAVKGISFNVKEGAFFALLGPNGAGKSTTIETIATLLNPTSGQVMINGFELGKDDASIRKAIGIVFQYSVLDKDLTVEENLVLRGQFYGMNKAQVKTRIESLDQVMDLAPILTQPIKTLSGGQKRKADIARALMHEPRLLMLDEPTTGLDPNSRKNIWDLILTIKAQTKMTILLTTHYMEEVSDADHVIIMHEGNIVAEDTAENLRVSHAKDTLKVYAKKDLSQTFKTKHITFHKVNKAYHIPLENAFKGIDIINEIKEDVESFEIIKASMDDVFLNITGAHLQGEII